VGLSMIRRYPVTRWGRAKRDGESARGQSRTKRKPGYVSRMVNDVQ
jgi:hypothetical protein